MGLVLRPSEMESGVQQIRSELNNMKDGYSGVMQTVLGFSGNEALQSQSWNRAKERIQETHQCIVQGMWAVQTIMEKNLDSLEASMDGAEDLDEDELFMQIKNLTEECEYYEIMIRMYQSMQIIKNICKPDITSSMGDQIEHYQKLLKQTEEELFELYKNPELDHKPEQLAKRGGAHYSDAACETIASSRRNFWTISGNQCIIGCY